MSQISARSMECLRACDQRCKPFCCPCCSYAPEVSLCTSPSPDWHSADFVWNVQASTPSRKVSDPVGWHPVSSAPLRLHNRRFISTPDFKSKHRATQDTGLVAEERRQSNTTTLDHTKTSLAESCPNTERNSHCEFDDCPDLDPSHKSMPSKSRWSYSTIQTFGSYHNHEEDSDTATGDSDVEDDDTDIFILDASQVTRQTLLSNPTYVDITRKSQFDPAQRFARESFGILSRGGESKRWGAVFSDEEISSLQLLALI